jgi:hypothetical protein
MSTKSTSKKPKAPTPRAHDPLDFGVIFADKAELYKSLKQEIILIAGLAAVAFYFDALETVITELREAFKEVTGR